MSDISYQSIVKNGLWENNPGLVQLLGLCPLLAVTASTINGLGLGLATLATLITTNVIVSLIRHLIRPEVRIPVFVMVIAATVTAIDLLLNAFFHDLHMILGIFIPLIVTNCVIIGRAEAFASKHTVSRAFADGFSMGLGFTVVLVILGTIREALGRGTILAQAELMFGDSARALKITLSDDYAGFLLAILPPGAFLAMGLLIAFKNIVDKKLENRAIRSKQTTAVLQPATEN